jgi:EpsI family protein
VKLSATGMLLSATLVIACHFGADWVRAGYGGQVQPPDQSVKSLPQELAGWHAVEERTLDKRTADVVGAGDFVSRVYRNAAGHTASVNVAVWTDLEHGPTGLHYPEVCYPNAGWQILASETVDVPAASGDQPLRLMFMQHADGHAVTGHWYQMGEEVFFSRGEARAIQQSFWGKRELPFIAKVLVQVSAPDLESAKPAIEELTAAIADWSERL